MTRAQLAVLAAAACLFASEADPILARVRNPEARPAPPASATAHALASVTARQEGATALEPDPALAGRAAQMRHALGSSPAAESLIDELLGQRPGYWPGVLERSDLRERIP